MDLSTVLVTLVFVLALVNIFFYFPTKKLQSFFKSHSTPKRVAPNSPISDPEPMIRIESELKRVFSTFDKDGDGFITKEELRTSLRDMKIVMSDEEMEETVARLDVNGDGLIEIGEFCELFKTVVGDGDGDGEGGLREAFDVFDGDRDGLISVEELGLVMGSLGMSEGRKMESCREMIKMVDLDGDGMVDFDEFKKMMRSK